MKKMGAFAVVLVLGNDFIRSHRRKLQVKRAWENTQASLEFAEKNADLPVAP